MATLHSNVVLFWTLFCSVLFIRCDDNLRTLRIIHNNDLHSRFSQSPIPEETCEEGDKCFGGFSRIVTAVEEIKNKSAEEQIPVLFLNGGDTFQKTLWYTVFKWKMALELTNLLHLDVMALGNHEFDDRPEGLAPFLNGVNCPVVACNIGVEEEVELAKTPIKKSVVLLVNGTRVGVIGYLTQDTKFKSQTGRVKFFDEVSSISVEAKRLREEGVKIIIALGHSGYKIDQKIAKSVPDIDVVVGGHSHTFLYSGDAPDAEIAEGLYPTLIRQDNGRLVAVVQAYAFSKYLGVLDVMFDSEGEVLGAGGAPLLLDDKIAEDENVLQVVDKWKKEFDNFTEATIGVSKVYLDSASCMFHECNMGNLVADALQYYVAQSSTTKGWTDASIAVVSGGSLKTSINASANDGMLTVGDIMKVLQYRDKVCLVNIEGKYLKEILEQSVSNYGRRQFLQVSGIKIVYNMLQPVGSRVSEVEVLCSDCDVPRYEALRDDQSYNVVVSAYIAQGGSGYTKFREHGVIVDTLDKLDADIVVQYITDIEFVYTGLSGRISTVQ